MSSRIAVGITAVAICIAQCESHHTSAKGNHMLSHATTLFRGTQLQVHQVQREKGDA